MGSLAEARPSDEDRGKSGRRTWYELRMMGSRVGVILSGTVYNVHEALARYSTYTPRTPIVAQNSPNVTLSSGEYTLVDF